MEIKVSNNGWVVIPAELRKKYNITPGTSVSIVDYGGVLTIIPIPENSISAAKGLLSIGEKRLTEGLKEEREHERNRKPNIDV